MASDKYLTLESFGKAGVTAEKRVTYEIAGSHDNGVGYAAQVDYDEAIAGKLAYENRRGGLKIDIDSTTPDWKLAVGRVTADNRFEKIVGPLEVIAVQRTSKPLELVA